MRLYTGILQLSYPGRRRKVAPEVMRVRKKELYESFRIFNILIKEEPALYTRVDKSGKRKFVWTNFFGQDMVAEEFLYKLWALRKLHDL